VFTKPDEWRRAESFRECTVTVSGKLYESPTGYYSADMAISGPELKPDLSCHPHPVKPDPTAARVPTDLRTFHASATVDYRGKGHVEIKVWKDQEKQVLLEPWQAYVSFMLTGGGDLARFGCREGYLLKNIEQVPRSSSEILEDIPNLAGASLEDQEGVNTITFQCEKKPATGAAKEKPALDNPKQ
jgi:hypothetical protein